MAKTVKANYSKNKYGIGQFILTVVLVGVAVLFVLVMLLRARAAAKRRRRRRKNTARKTTRTAQRGRRSR